ncbi:hypothetical protein DC030_14970, partial [Enterococcus faecalis]
APPNAADHRSNAPKRPSPPPLHAPAPTANDCSVPKGAAVEIRPKTPNASAANSAAHVANARHPTGTGGSSTPSPVDT